MFKLSKLRGSGFGCLFVGFVCIDLVFMEVFFFIVLFKIRICFVVFGLLVFVWFLDIDLFLVLCFLFCYSFRR